MTEVTKEKETPAAEMSEQERRLAEQEFYVQEDGTSILLTPVKIKRQGRAQVNWWTATCAVMVALAGYLFFFYKNKTQIQLLGSDSVATILETAGVLSATICFLIAFVKYNQKMEKGWVRIGILAISFALILEFSTTLFVRMLGEIFAKASFDMLTTSILLVVFSLIFNAMLWSLGQSLSVKQLIYLLSVVIVLGTLTAMILNGNQFWWQNNFSFLGTNDAVMKWQFNLTLLVSAVLMAILINTLFAEVYKHFGRLKKLIILQTVLLVIALNLGAVGFFPYTQGRIGSIHNFVAQNLVVFIVVLIIAIFWLLPQRNRQFLWFSAGIASGLMLVSYLFYGIHYLSLTAFELLAFVLAFWWLLSLFNVLLESTLKTTVYTVHLTKKER